MLRSLLVVLFYAALLVTACTTPSSRTAVAPEASGDMVASRRDVASAPAAAAADEDDPLVCKKVIQIGTRVAQRICMRRSQVETNQRDAREMLGEVQKRGVLVNESKQ
ncbi:MAG: hypothetical protein E2O54_13630 [Gammaproteobacteria bacterium]|jgi:hypothetical protein|nr:MAG: hypothetical protein E2O54_13630 [Gammaproteobacteria bacterium]